MSESVVVITGAGSGLGASLARKYSDAGSHVCLLGRTRSKLERTAGELKNSHTIYEVDVSSKEDVDRVFRDISETHGPVDLLINNAGIGVFDLAENLDESAVHQMIDINLKGTIFCSQAVLPQMKKRDRGMIANIVSTAGLDGKATESVYSASKFGVRGFTESLQLELAESRVRIFAAYMGGMKSEFWDGIYTQEEMANLMEPDDVADIIIGNIKARRNLNVKEVVIKNSL
ncbi:putative oxidoreductase [Bhargavaea cecembensis DSE10]|uniref:Putative oxidoreductase n=1 Tax=Bhargavaea cecembensis DSE10 TaxID=1235279 RepID=M7NDR8_9BACL|nr:SDR family oxidoreductase [Bhargavaea cecembensis]EMR05402.1 putative oxidoreductase [Bhargavaea cecembensis DSE10]